MPGSHRTCQRCNAFYLIPVLCVLLSISLLPPTTRPKSAPCTVPPGSLTSPTEPNGDQADTALFSMGLWLLGKPTRSKLLLTKPSSSLIQIILLLSGQISPNPGPPRYPCVECGKAVRTNQKGLQCDDCLYWCHSACIGMSNNKPLTSPHLFDTNPYSILSESETSLSDSQHLSDIGSPIHASSPTKQNTAKRQMLQVLQLNFNSLKSSGKKAELQILIERHNPDIIVGCESKLVDTHASHSIFPETYVVERNDRNRHGAGLILAIKAELNPMPENHLSTSIDNYWCSVQPKNGKTLLIGSFYRPPSDTPDELEHLNRMLSKVFAPKSIPNIIIGGDFNASGINWTDDDEPIGRDTCLDAVKNKLQGIANRYGLCQYQHNITRPESQTCLDLVFTNNPSIIKNVTTAPGMGDHLAVLYDVACEVPRNTTLRRKLFKFNKANIPNMAQDMNSLHQTRREGWSCHTAEENWTHFHNALTATMKRNIPQTTTGKRNNLPWVTDTVRKSIAKRDRAFKKTKRRNSPRLWEAYRALRNSISKTSLVTWTLLPRMTSLRALNASGGMWSPTNVNVLVYQPFAHNLGSITPTSTKPRYITTSSRVPSLGKVWTMSHHLGSPPTPCALTLSLPLQALTSYSKTCNHTKPQGLIVSLPGYCVSLQKW